MELADQAPGPGTRRGFGFQRTPTHRHQGIDVGAPRGYPIESVADGTVTHASDKLEEGFSGYGRHVVVVRNHPGPQWFLFAHLEDVNVEPGDTVEFGELLGTVGDSCFDRSDADKACRGTHIHFEVSPTPYPQGSEAQRLDPVAWLREEAALTSKRQDRARVPAPVPKPKKKKKKKRKPEGLTPGSGLAILISAALSFVFILLRSRAG